MRGLFAFGFFDRASYVDDDSRVDKTGHRRLRPACRRARHGPAAQPRRAAARRIQALDSLAVIGADADRYVNGGGSSAIRPYRSRTCARDHRPRRAAESTCASTTGADLDRAAQVAGGADAAVVVVADAASEGIDKPCLGLDCGCGRRRGPTLQRDAARRASGGGEPAHDRGARDRGAGAHAVAQASVQAIVEAWYPGEAGGPGGRARAVRRRRPGRPAAGHLPALGGRPPDRRRAPPATPESTTSSTTARGSWSATAGSTGAGSSPRSRSASGSPTPASRCATCACGGPGSGVGATRERSTSPTRAIGTGIAVPQLYLGLPGAAGRIQPPRQLKGFESVQLEARRRQARHLQARRARLLVLEHRNRWQVAPGCYRIYVASSSRDIAGRRTLALGGGSCGSSSSSSSGG